MRMYGVVAVGMMSLTVVARASILLGPDKIPPPLSIDRDPPVSCASPGPTNSGQQGFDETQGVVTTVSLDHNATIPSGSPLDSHMIFLQVPGGASTNAIWCFDGLILGLMSDEGGLLEQASNAALGDASVCYPSPFSNRGLEPLDSYRYHGSTLELNMSVTTPGDWVRVVTTREEALGITFSVDHQGASRGLGDGFAGLPIGEGDILTVSDSAFRLPSPPSTGAPPPGVLVSAEGLGLSATGSGITEVDALSYGVDRGNKFVFSVDEWAVGCIPGTPGKLCSQPSALHAEGGCTGSLICCADPTVCNLCVSSCDFGGATNNEASADLFAHIPGGGNDHYLDGGELGLVEPSPMATGVPDDGDNLDAVDVQTSSDDLAGRIYFSLEGSNHDVNEQLGGSDTAAANGFSGADVLVLDSCPDSVGAIQPRVFASAADLGLSSEGDDLDALVLVDENGIYDGWPTDEMYFSVRRGSSSIGAAPCNDPTLAISEGDILMPPSQGCSGSHAAPAIYAKAGKLGLSVNPVDDLDALDRVVGPPVGVELPAPIRAGTGLELRVTSSSGSPDGRNFVLDVQGEVAVSVHIFSATGRLVSRVAEREKLDAGRHVFQWDGRDHGGRAAGSGVYFVQALTSETAVTRKFVVVR